MITFTMLIGVIFVILSKLPTILEQHLAPDAVIGLPLFRTGWNSELVCYGAKHFQTYLCSKSLNSFFSNENSSCFEERDIGLPELNCSAHELVSFLSNSIVVCSFHLVDESVCS